MLEIDFLEFLLFAEDVATELYEINLDNKKDLIAEMQKETKHVKSEFQLMKDELSKKAGDFQKSSEGDDALK